MDVRTASTPSPHAVLPVAQAYTKRWLREAAPPALGATGTTAGTGTGTLPVLPGSPAGRAAQDRKVQWEVGRAGYKPPGGEVTAEQIRAAASLLSSASRVSSMIKDPLTRQACARVGVIPEELELKPKSAFAFIEGKAIPASAEVQEDQWQVRRPVFAVLVAQPVHISSSVCSPSLSCAPLRPHPPTHPPQSYVRRMSSTLAAVLAERERMVQSEAQRKEREAQFTKAMVKRFDEEMKAEADKVAREERALERLAKVRPVTLKPNPCAEPRVTRTM